MYRMQSHIDHRQNIKINDKDKHLFDMFKAEFTLEAGKKITRQELFSRIMEFVRVPEYLETVTIRVGTIKITADERR